MVLGRRIVEIRKVGYGMLRIGEFGKGLFGNSDLYKDFLSKVEFEFWKFLNESTQNLYVSLNFRNFDTLVLYLAACLAGFVAWTFFLLCYFFIVPIHRLFASFHFEVCSSSKDCFSCNGYSSFLPYQKVTKLWVWDSAERPFPACALVRCLRWLF